jgi:putative transcriptional regulator
MKNEVHKGDFLIAEPFLGDPNFERSVIILCEHNDQGSFGLVVNQETELMLGDVLEETIYQDFPLFLGGPVENNTLHFLHRRPDLINGGVAIQENLYWGGDFEQVKTCLNLNQISQEEIRFFAGYSGWGAYQLSEELTQKAWIVTSANADFLFKTPAQNFWREVLRQMGGEYRSIAHYPVDPSLN